MTIRVWSQIVVNPHTRPQSHHSFHIPHHSQSYNHSHSQPSFSLPTIVLNPPISSHPNIVRLHSLFPSLATAQLHWNYVSAIIPACQKHCLPSSPAACKGFDEALHMAVKKWIHLDTFKKSGVTAWICLPCKFRCWSPFTRFHSSRFVFTPGSSAYVRCFSALLALCPAPPSPQPSGCLQVSTACRWPAKPRHTAHRRTTMAARLCPQHPQNVCMDILSLYEFTGSGWYMWFSSRKCRLYKLGTQENLATDIKPIWGILEKWPRIRSAFSKLCLTFFLRKTPPYLNRIVLQLRYQACWKPLQVTAIPFF